MEALVIYGSAYGNTEKIAQAIGEGLGGSVLRVDKVQYADLQGVGLLVVGSPTQGGRALKEVNEFLEGMSSMESTKAATFDTRFDINRQKLGLRLLMKTIGYAAPKISAKLAKQGVKIVSEPEGFIVEDKEGPLAKGEIERAKKWGDTLRSL